MSPAVLFLPALIFSFLSGPFVGGPPREQTLEVGPMHVSWRYTTGDITFRVTSPERGWIVLGCNDENDIVGATLFMGGHYPAGSTYFSERAVLAPGDHRSHEVLGIPERVSRVEAGITSAGGTFLTITLPATARSEGEHDLRPGQEIWLILAYSASDDLDHHSRFRRHVRVRL